MTMQQAAASLCTSQLKDVYYTLPAHPTQVLDHMWHNSYPAICYSAAMLRIPALLCRKAPLVCLNITTTWKPDTLPHNSSSNRKSSQVTHHTAPANSGSLRFTVMSYMRCKNALSSSLHSPCKECMTLFMRATWSGVAFCTFPCDRLPVNGDNRTSLQHKAQADNLVCSRVWETNRM